MTATTDTAPTTGFGAALDDAMRRPVSGELVDLALSLATQPLGADDRIVHAQLCARLASALQTESWLASAAAATPQPTAVAGMLAQSPESLHGELELALVKSSRQVSGDLDIGDALDDLPRMRALGQDGRVSAQHLRAIVEETRHLPDGARRELDEELADRATRCTSGAFRQLVRRKAARYEREDARARAKRIREAQDVALFTSYDGTAEVVATMGTIDAAAIMNAVQARAEALRLPADPRTLGERRVAALCDALGVTRLDDPRLAPVGGDGAASPVASPAPSGRAAQVTVLIDWRALLGLTDGHGYLPGIDTLHQADVRSLLAMPGTTLRRLVFDPVTGRALDYAQKSYEAADVLRDLLAIRDQTCRFPACTRRGCLEVEHLVPYDEGGPTSTSNCALVCHEHHELKTRHGHSYERPDPSSGEVVWTTALGFRYRRDPTTYGPDGVDPGGYGPEPRAPDPPAT